MIGHILPYDHVEKNAWNQFCYRAENAWFWHTTHFLDYLAVEAENLSFVLTDHEFYILGIVPLVFRDGKEVDSYPLPAPILSSEIPPEIVRMLWDHTNHICDHHKIVQWRVRDCPLAQNATLHQEYFKNNEFTKLHHSYMVDLREPKEVRWQAVRKSYRSVIHKFQSTARFLIEYTPGPMFEALQIAYQKAHEGRAIRPAGTWDEMRKWIREGHAYLCGAQVHGEWAGFALINVYKGSAYYGIGISRESGVMSYILWETQQYLTQYGFKLFELGWSDVGETEKEKNIAFFKKGLSMMEMPWIEARVRP